MPAVCDYFGATLHLRFSAAIQENFYGNVLLAPSGTVAGVPLTVVETLAPGDDRFSRSRKATPAAWQELVKQFRTGSITSLLAYDRKLPASAPSNEPLFTLSLDAKGQGCAQLSVTVPRHLYRQEEMRAYLRSICSEIDAAHGYLCSGEFRYVQSLISFVPIGKPNAWMEDTVDETEEQLKQELLFYQNCRDQQLERLARAARGNTLSPAQVAALGGEDTIRQRSGCYLVERWGHNLYLQLTESPWRVTAGQLLKLNEFLSPVRLAGAPRPVYREGSV